VDAAVAKKITLRRSETFAVALKEKTIFFLFCVSTRMSNDIITRLSLLNLLGSPATTVAPRKKQHAAAKPLPTPKNTAFSGEITDFKLDMMNRIEPSERTRYGENNLPQYIYHVARCAEWMASAERYFPVGDLLLKCCDSDRLNAYVSRNNFYAQYVERIECMDTMSGRLYRSINDTLVGVLHKLSVNKSTNVNREQVPSSVPNHDMYSTCVSETMLTDEKYTLLILDTASFVQDASLTWETVRAYPAIMRPVYKNRDICLDFELRYDAASLSVCLPPPELLKERRRALKRSIDCANEAY
jgi:hypothetical protein